MSGSSFIICSIFISAIESKARGRCAGIFPFIPSAVATAFATGGASVGTAAAALAAVAATYGLSQLAGGSDLGGNATGNYNYPSGSAFSYGAGNPTYNIVVNAIDGEGAARAVAQTLNSQAARSTTALRDR